MKKKRKKKKNEQKEPKKLEFSEDYSVKKLKKKMRNLENIFTNFIVLEYFLECEVLENLPIDIGLLSN